MAIQTINLIGNRYELLEKLGSGGMGEVFKALDRLTGAQVALKRVLVSASHLQFNTHSDSDELQLALAREFRVLASLRHPNIISVLDYGFDIDTLPFFTMTLLDNAVPLLGYSKDFTAVEKIRLIIDLLQALAYLHRRGILHRDLKPNNIMVQAGTLLVFDFGVALEYQQNASKGIAGTLAYIAPEIFLGKGASPASDLFSVGVILYQILTGEHPFPSRSQGKMGDFATEKPDLSAIEAIEISTIAQANAPTTPQEDDDDRTFVKGDLTTMDAGVEFAFDEEDHTVAVYKTHHVDSMREPVAVSGVSQGLAAIVGRLLEYDPTKRYTDAMHVIQDLCTASGLPLPIETREIRESFIQSARFVGRVTELENLTYSLSQMLFRKKGVAWLIGGESGVGKSRLVDELRTQAMIKGAMVVRGQAIEGGGLPYHLWRDVLPGLITSIDLSDLEIGILKSILPNIKQILGREVSNPPLLEGKAEQDRLTFAIADVFKRQKQPVVLILEDLQWTIESLAPLKHLLQILDSLRLMIVATYRSDERPDLPEDLAGMNVLALPRLDTDEIAQLSASMLGEPGNDSHLVELLQRETQGNVFFMVEVVRSLAEEAGRLQDIGKFDLPEKVITGGIQSILQRRIQRVPYAYQPLLKLTAVAGRLLDRTLLTNLAPSTIQVDDWLYRCGALAILDVQDGQWRFSHDKLRESLIGTLSDMERIAAHRQVASALEATYPNDSGYAQVLAEHWYQAQNIPKAVDYTLQAVEQLHRVSSFAVARQLVERMLLLTTDEARWLKLALWAGEIELRMGNYVEAILHYQNAVERAIHLQDAYAEATALAGLAMASWRQGAYEDSQAYTEDAYQLATTIGDLKTTASCLSRMGIMAYSQGDYTTAIQHYQQSLAISRDLGDKVRINSALNDLGVMLIMNGQSGAAIDCFHESLAISREIGDKQGEAYCLNNLGVFATDPNVGILDFLQAIDYYRQSLTIYEDISDEWGVAMCHINLFGASLEVKNGQVLFKDLATGLRLAQQVIAIPLVLEALGCYAFYLSRERRFARAAQLQGYIIHHPALPDELRQNWVQKVEAMLMDFADYETEMEIGRTMSLETVVEAILEELA